MKVPTGMQAVMPYLILNNAEGFIAFTVKVFNAAETMRHLSEDGKIIRHAQVKIDDCTIMCAESIEQWPPQNANLFIYVDNADETYGKALSNGAETIMPPANQEYGRSCGVKDPFGNTWWITSVI